MDPDFVKILQNSQGTTLKIVDVMFGLSSDLQRGIFTKHVDEVEMVEAAASRQIMHREAPINATA